MAKGRLQVLRPPAAQNYAPSVPEHFAKVKKDLVLCVLENEFVIVTCPKSGTHLMTQVRLQLLGKRLD